jgi:hypothetical protein
MAWLLLASIRCLAGPIAIQWNPAAAEHGRLTVELLGLQSDTLDRLRRSHWTPSQWQQLFSVFAEQGNVLNSIGLPPMAGSYSVQADRLRFEAAFPLEPDVTYRAEMNADQLPGHRAAQRAVVTSVFRFPARPKVPSTEVAAVYPSGEIVPENLLKFYLHFTAPMRRGHIYDHIHLRDEGGTDIELPFLEIDEELWNPELTRLTLFIDPGRIKRGVKPLEEIGPALEPGKRYTLVVDAEWVDAAGAPLRSAFRKRFLVGPPDRDPPDPASWKITPPRSRSREPLTVAFAEPMDHALVQRMIRVRYGSEKLIQGQVSVGNSERQWTFVPSNAWQAGGYTLDVDSMIEDRAGNNIGKPFEVDLFEKVERRVQRPVVRLAFEVP